MGPDRCGRGTRLEGVMTRMTRRFALLCGAAFAFGPLRAGAAPGTIAVHKDPNCDCCAGWVEIGHNVVVP
jgi:hypothetical protein